MKKAFSNMLYNIYYFSILIALIASFIMLCNSIINDNKDGMYPWDFAMLLAIFISIQYVR